MHAHVDYIVGTAPTLAICNTVFQFLASFRCSDLILRLHISCLIQSPRSTGSSLLVQEAVEMDIDKSETQSTMNLDIRSAEEFPLCQTSHFLSSGDVTCTSPLETRETRRQRYSNC
jgi:hypothetical protein